MVYDSADVAFAGGDFGYEIVNSAQDGDVDSAVIFARRLERVVQLGEQQRQRVGNDEVLRIVAVIKVIRRCRATDEGNRVIDQNATAPKHSVSVLYLTYSKIAGLGALHEVMWTGFDEAAMQHGNCFLVRLAGGYPGQRWKISNQAISELQEILLGGSRLLPAQLATLGGKVNPGPMIACAPPDLLELIVVPDRASGTLAIEQEYGTVTPAAKVRMIRRGKWKLVYQPLERGYAQRLFNLESDPACQDNISAQHPSVLLDLGAGQNLSCPTLTGELNFQFSQGRIGSKDWSASRFGVRRWSLPVPAELCLGLLQAQPNLVWG